MAALDQRASFKPSRQAAEAAAAITQDEMDAAPAMMEINADISSLFRISPQHTVV
jgi:hypothetical protein